MIRQFAKTVAAVLLCGPSMAVAELPLHSLGLTGVDSTKKFSGMRQYGASFSLGISRWSDRAWLPNELEASVGRISASGDSAAFLSIGPAYRLPIGRSAEPRMFVNFGVLPTIFSDSRFGGKDLGGNFHFTSFIGFGGYLDQRRTTSLMFRFQHTSNAGIDDKNPGVDMAGITFRYEFGRQLRGLTADAKNR